MNRTRYLVSYDICNPRRLRRVAKVLEGYGWRLQFSVFECALDDLRLEAMKADLTEEINHDEDQIMFVSLGPFATDANLTIETVGRPYSEQTKMTII